MKTSKIGKLFKLTWKKLWILIVSGFIAIMLHNAFYAIFNIEEPVFFLIAVIIIPFYFIISLIYTIILKLTIKRNS